METPVAASSVIGYGHWDNAGWSADGSPRPCVVGRTIGIDTITHGVRTAVRMPDLAVMQSRLFAAYPPR